MNDSLSPLPTALPSAEDETTTVFIEDLLVYQISATVIAISSFAANCALGAAALYARRPRTASRAKTTIFLSQASAGLLSPISVIYPSKLSVLHYSNHPQTKHLDFLTNYSSCLATSTIPIVISTMAPVAHTFLLTLDLYLPLVDCQLAWQHWAVLAGIAWFFILLIAFLPLFGWNNWHGLCYIPSTWTSNYSGMISMLIILQTMACAYMLLGAFIRSRRGKEPLTEEEISQRELLPQVPPWEAKARFASLLVLLFCDLPLLLHILVHADIMSAGLPPLYQLAWIVKHDAVMSWTIIISLISSSLLPPIIIAADPVLSAALVAIGHRAWCCRPRYMRTNRHSRRQRNNAVSPADWDRGSSP